MALRNRQEPAKEAHRGKEGQSEKEREREMDSEGEAGSLTDGLTGWIVELAGCC